MFESTSKIFPKTEMIFRDFILFKLQEAGNQLSTDIKFNNQFRDILIISGYLQAIDGKMGLVIHYYNKINNAYNFLLNNKTNEDNYSDVEFRGSTELIIFELKCCLDNVTNVLNLLYFNEIKNSSLYTFQKSIENIDNPLYIILNKNNNWIKALNDIRNNIVHNHKIDIVFNFDSIKSDIEMFKFIIKYIKKTHDSIYQMCSEIDKLIYIKFYIK